MRTETRELSGSRVLFVAGDIDMYTSPALRKELMELVQRRERLLMVDLSGVSYIDSSGIATFVEVLKAAMSYGGRLKLLAISENILDIFNFAKLDKVFEIYRSAEDALNS